jgi:hypothetical protein
MNACLKKIVIILGGILLAVFLIVPYTSRHVIEQRERSSVLVFRTTTKGRGYMFLPKFLKARAANGVVQDIQDRRRDYYELNQKTLGAEIAAVVVIGVLDYLFFCRRRNERRPGQGL